MIGKVAALGLGLALVITVGASLKPISPEAGPLLALPVQHKQDVPSLRNDQYELLLFNFRVVEPGILYRSSGFPRNRVSADGKSKTAAAYADAQAFRFLRARNIKTVVTLQEKDQYYGEEGYYDYWAQRTGYRVNILSLPLKSSEAYDRDARSGLAAAAKFLEIMRKRRPDDGAVLVHCDVGKDRTGVVIAAYELWRNHGQMDAEKLWQQVRRRYLASNDVLARDDEVSRFAGGKVACPEGDEIKKGYVCPGWFDKLRPDLELLARL